MLNTEVENVGVCLLNPFWVCGVLGSHVFGECCRLVHPFESDLALVMVGKIR